MPCDAARVGSQGDPIGNGPNRSLLPWFNKRGFSKTTDEQGATNWGILLANPFQSFKADVSAQDFRLLCVQRGRTRGEIYGSSRFANSILGFVERCKTMRLGHAP